MEEKQAEAAPEPVVTAAEQELEQELELMAAAWPAVV